MSSFDENHTPSSQLRWGSEEWFFSRVSETRIATLKAHTEPQFRVWRDLALGTRVLHTKAQTEVWYGEKPWFVRIVQDRAPYSLAGRILRYEADLPHYDRNLEIVNDQVQPIPFKPTPVKRTSVQVVRKSGHNPAGISKDVAEAMETLPTVQFDKTLHTARHPRSSREISILKATKGSPYIVELLGRTEDNKIVFPKFRQTLASACKVNKSLATLRDWMLDIIEGMQIVQSHGSMFPDLRPGKILVGKPLVLTEVDSTYAWCLAPELKTWDESIPMLQEEGGISMDVYALAKVLQRLSYGCAPPTPHIDWPVPAPFDEIYERCTNEDEDRRPSLMQMTWAFERAV